MPKNTDTLAEHSYNRTYIMSILLCGGVFLGLTVLFTRSLAAHGTQPLYLWLASSTFIIICAYFSHTIASFTAQEFFSFSDYKNHRILAEKFSTYAQETYNIRFSNANMSLLQRDAFSILRIGYEGKITHIQFSLSDKDKISLIAHNAELHHSKDRFFTASLPRGY